MIWVSSLPPPQRPLTSVPSPSPSLRKRPCWRPSRIPWKSLRVMMFTTPPIASEP